MTWAEILKAICPKGRTDVIAGLAEAMPEIISNFDVNTPLRQAHFLSQVCHESGGLRYVKEIWGPTPAQTRYEGRKDLGNTQKGDGKRFMGRGLIQITGRDNYLKFGQPLNVDLSERPEMLESFPFAALSAAAFWKANNLNSIADLDDCHACTKRVNGGLNGFQERQIYLARAKAQLTGEDHPLLDVDILPAEKIKVLQGQLDGLGYHCIADGQVGSQTIGALAAFQHDNNLPINPTFDDATQEALWGAEKRAVAPSRAEGVPDSSRILQGSSALQKGAMGVGATIVAKASADPVAALTGVNGYYDQMKAALAPFGVASDFITSHWMVMIGVLAAAVFAYAKQIEKARIEDHQSGKTT